jgi:hypothetical protein
MTYQFGPDEPIAEGARRIARKEIDGAIEALGWDDRNAGVHDVRKRFKKLRALLRLTHDTSDKEALRARIVAFRDAARTIAHLRDSRVLVDAVLALARETEGNVPELAAMHEVLEARHRQLYALELADGTALAQLDLPLRSFRRDVDGWGLSASEFAEIAPRLARTYRRGRRAHRVAREDPTLENLHQWRKRVKDLWYHARLLLGRPKREGPLGPGHRLVADLDALANHLGLDHDYALLRALVVEGSVLPTSEEASRTLLEFIDRRRAALQAQAWPLGPRIYDAAPETFVVRVDQLRSGRRTRFGSAAD